MPDEAAHVQDNVNPQVVHLFKGTFLLDAIYIYEKMLRVLCTICLPFCALLIIRIDQDKV